MIDDPNVVLPLATSYNERGIAGYTHVVTNSEDQRKVNCLYELSKNPMTGKGTLTLSKRQGVSAYTAVSTVSLSASVDIAYLIVDLLFSNPTSHGIVYIDNAGQIEFGPDGFHSRTVLSSPSGKKPAYIEVTAISNSVASVTSIVSLQPMVVLQIANLSNSVPQRVFFAQTSDAAIGNAWTEISDGDFTGWNHEGKMEFIDGFAFILTDQNLIFNSDSNRLDNWNPANFLAKQIKQDKAQGLARLSNRLLAFGRETVEVFYNAGNTLGSPLGRVQQQHQRIGLMRPRWAGGTSYYCTIGDTMYFVGKSGGGDGGSGTPLSNCGLYKYDGFTFSKISSTYIEKILSEKATGSSIFSVNSMILSGQQFVAICFTAPNVSPQVWLMYSPLWNEWFEWTSTVFSPVNSGSRYLGFGINQTLSYVFGTSDTWQDESVSYQFLTQFRLPTNGSTRKSMLMYGVDADTDTSSNFISVDVSDNDCQSFYSLQPLNLTWERKVNFRGGSYTRRHIRLQATDSRPKRIANFIARIE